MKSYLKTLAAFFYLFVSMVVLVVTIIYPFALSFDNPPPIWTCWIIYPLTVVVMASQPKMIKWCDKVISDN